jgi:hypothetical protein
MKSYKLIREASESDFIEALNEEAKKGGKVVSSNIVEGDQIRFYAIIEHYGNETKILDDIYSIPEDIK